MNELRQIEMVKELAAAHKIIQNALNLMTLEQKAAWGKVNERDGVDGDGITRANEREAILEQAKAEALFNGAKSPGEAERTPTPPRFQLQPRT